MAKIDIVQRLSQALDSFQLHDKLLPELLPLIQKCSYKVKFFDVLVNRLTFLKEHGRLASNLHKELERIDEDIYSMHIVVPDLNLRILYSFQMDRTILLHAFYEREDKSKTDYTNSLPTARRRKTEMEE